MKTFIERYWPLVGAAGIAVAAGLYKCSNITSIFLKQENKPSQEWLGNKEPRIENHEKKTSVPAHYDQPKVKKETDIKKTQKNKYDPSEFPEKELSWVKRRDHYNLTPPRPSRLEDKVEEDTERPWYDLSAEKRDAMDGFGLVQNFYAALEADDYKVAESYIQNLQKFAEPATAKNKDKQNKEFASIIIYSYNYFLNEVIENCDQDYDSVFRKIMWMNLYIVNNLDLLPVHYPDTNLPVYDPYTKKTIDLFALQQKGTEALEAIEYCVEKKNH